MSKTSRALSRQLRYEPLHRQPGKRRHKVDAGSGYVHASVEQLEPRFVLTTPTLAAIGNVTLIAGAPLHIALDGFDADNDTLTFSATSTNADVSTAIPTGNRSLKINVAGFGEMTFQLFEDLTPRATAQIIALANSGFYNGVTFHRILNDFVIQGGDPTGTGSGRSQMPDFDDQYNLALQHTSTGLLSMAKSTDDDNNSQFFIPEGPQRHADFNFSIFGFLTTGESVRQAISNVPTNASGTPTTPVTMSNVSVFADSRNGVLRLSAPEGTTGTSTITVTVDDGHGGSAERSFNVNIVADTVNNNPFLEDIPAVTTTPNTPVTIQLHGIEAEGEQVYYFDADGILQYFGISSPITSNPNLTYFVDQVTGLVTVTPLNGIHGTFPIFVGAANNAGTGGGVDTQVVLIHVVGEPVPSAIVGRHLFYDNSTFDGNLSGLNEADDAALATDKTALLPGEIATLANYTSYSRGINGIMIDMTGLTGTLSASDFTFRTGNDNKPMGWATVAAPETIVVRPAAGAAGSSRVELAWADQPIKNSWLQVTVNATSRTGLAQADVFYFGNAVGESGNDLADAIVNSVDELAARNNPQPFHTPATITNRYDYNRDGLVNATDQILARSSSTTPQAALKLIALGQTGVLGRRLFYNNSKFDGNASGLNSADDDAIATDKTALLPGATATLANYTSYSQGINGVMIDVVGLTGTPTANDFIFRAGNDDNPVGWATAPAPTSIVVRPGAGVSGSSRISLGWTDGAIKNTWLQIIVKATAVMGLSQPDVFYFGNAVGETGNDPANAIVNATDEVAARTNPRSYLDLAPIDSPYDFNRDGFVNATDQILARSNSTVAATCLKLIHPFEDMPIEIDPIADVTLVAGAPLQIPLTGFGADVGVGALTFSFSSTNPAITGTTNTANRSLKLTVDHTGGTPADSFSGAMVFELFEDRAPHTAARIIELAQSGFYDGTIFHRVINNFVIQGGDPLGTGTGGSGTTFDDEFTPLLQHTSTGLLAMAKSGDDTNDSQIYVTEGPQRRLDFNHAIFGRLTQGENLRDKISNVPVSASDRPISAVTVTSATVFFDPRGRVLSLSAPIGATGSGDFTVTVSDGNGRQAQRTFHVTIAPDTTNNRPILGDIAPIWVPFNGTANFQLTSLDVEGDPVFYDKATPDFNLTLTLGSGTGAGTLTAKNNFAGVNSIYVGVRAPSNDGSGIDQYDGQAVPVLVAPPAPTTIDLLASSDTGVSNTDNITSRNNRDVANTLQFLVFGVVSGAEVTLFDGNVPIGSAIATGASVTVTTNGAFELLPGQHAITAKQTLKDQSLSSVSNSTQSVDIPSLLSAPQSITIVSELASPAMMMPLFGDDNLIEASTSSGDVLRCAAHDIFHAAMRSDFANGYAQDANSLWSLLAEDSLYARKMKRFGR